MAKIILAWGYHLSESPVTKELAELLKPVLERRNHSVQIVQIPEELAVEDVKKHAKRHDNRRVFLKELIADNPNAFVIDLHTSSDKKSVEVFVKVARRIKFFSEIYQDK